MSTGLSDDILLERVRAGQQQAFRTLVDRYKQLVFTAAYRILNNSEDAEEAAQDAFVNAFRHLDQFKGESKFSSWLFRIAANGALNMRNKKQLMQVSLDDSTVQPGVYDRDHLQDEDRRKILHRCMQHLHSDDALILTLFYMEERKLEEIATDMGLELSTAKVRLHRARIKLAALVQKSMEHEPEPIL